MRKFEKVWKSVKSVKKYIGGSNRLIASLKLLEVTSNYEASWLADVKGDFAQAETMSEKVATRKGWSLQHFAASAETDGR